MFTRFKQKNELLFIGLENSEKFELAKSKKVDIILSPSMYWVKKIVLPVKSVREAKTLLPSIFEENIPAGNYSYDAYKSGDSFIAFAYEDKKILDKLNSLGITVANIGSIYFAQSEFKELEHALKVSDDQAIYLQDDILVLVPSSWVETSDSIDLENFTLSKKKINLQQYGHIVDKRSLYKIGGVLGLLIIILLAEIFIANTKLEKMREDREALFSKYKLQSTMFQNKASLKKYSKIHATQTKLREYISLFLSMHLQKTQKLTLLQYKNKILSVTISGVNKSTQNRVLTPLNRKKIKYNSSLAGNILKVEIKL